MRAKRAPFAHPPGDLSLKVAQDDRDTELQLLNLNVAARNSRTAFRVAWYAG
jgi:hypothetical protein